MSFKERLKEEILYQGLILKELADKANVSKRTLESYTNSRTQMPAADVAVRLAQALSTTVEYLVTGNETAKNDKEVNKYKPIRDIIDDLLSMKEETLESARIMVHALAETDRKKTVSKLSKTV